MGIARQSPPSAELIVFSDRLQKAIEFKKIDVAALAKDSEYKPDDINKLLTGMKEPGLKKLTLLANSLGCSVDYLLGLTPEAKRATVVVTADTNAIEPPSSEHGQTSGQISANVEQITTLLPKLFESDVELIRFIIEFLVEKRSKRVSKFMNSLIGKIGKPSKEVDSIPKETPSKKDDDLSDDDFDEEDDLWDAIEDDELKDEDWEEDEDNLETDDDDDDDFDDFDE